MSGDPSDERIDLEGDLAGVHFIGYGMKSGTVHVHGNAGRHVGGEMSGGRIVVDGNAGDYAGCEMHGGMIHVAGNAGNRIGAAYPGSKKGMTDGTILIGGDVGSEAGASMRRGTLVVRGFMRRRHRFQHDRRQHPRVWIVWRPARCRHAAGDARTLRHRADQALAHLPARRPLPAAFSPTALSRTGSTRVPGRPRAAGIRAVALLMAIWSPWEKARSG